MAEKSDTNETHWNKMREIPEESRARAQTTHSPTETASSSQQLHPELRRQTSTSEPTIPVADKDKLNTDFVPSGRQRSSSHTPMSTTAADFFKNHSASLTENARKLSEEEIDALVIDIFKPLDFYEILFDRMKMNDQQGNNGGQSDMK